MLTKTSLTHSTVRLKIKRAALRAYFEARKTNKRVSVYVTNKHGNNTLRLDYISSLQCFAAYDIKGNSLDIPVFKVIINTIYNSSL
jgi:hypothetical protein